MRKSVSQPEKRSKTIAWLDAERVDVGIDTHKRAYDVTLWSEQRGGVVRHWQQPADPALVADRLRPFQERVRRVVYEAGPTGYGLARRLRAEGFSTEVIAPSKMPRTPGQESKSDRLDSRKLAMWSAKSVLQPVYVPSEQEEDDRQVFRARDGAVCKRRRVKQQIKSFLLMRGAPEPEGLKNWSKAGVEALRRLALEPGPRFALDLLLDDLAHFEGQVQKADSAVKALAKTARHSRAVHALRTVPGVGAVTAMAVRTELLAPARFTHAEQVAAMAGLAPLITQSGQTLRNGPLMKSGNARLRTILIEAAWRWVARDEWAKGRFTQLVRNTGERKKAIAAMARRLIIILWRMELAGEPYRPRPCPQLKRQSPRRGKKGQPGLRDRGETKGAAQDAAAPRVPIATGVAGRLPGEAL